MNEILMYVFAGIAFLASAYMLFSRNILYSALALVLVLVSLAGLFVLYGAEFVAAAQLMIYAGGILILMLFVIMLTANWQRNRLVTNKYRFIPSLLAGAAIFSYLALLFREIQGTLPAADMNLPIKSLGLEMLTTYLVPVEVLAILLLVVLIGALTIARDYYQRKPDRQ